MYAKFKSHISAHALVQVNVKGRTRVMTFSDWFLTVYDKNTIEALMGDARYGKHYSVEKETLDLSEAALKVEPSNTEVNVTKEEAVVADKLFRTVNEAREWLKEKFDAPATVNTTAKCIEFAKKHDVIIGFNRD